MGNTKIQYGTKTWNIVTGCSKISKACENCWAETMSKRPIYAKTFGGDFQPRFHPERLNDPTKWKKPQRVLVSFQGDIFHDDIFHNKALTGGLLNIFDVMRIKAPQHKYILLTKRPENMTKFINAYREVQSNINLSNIWFGVSVEDQKTTNERIPALCKIPNINKWVSIEPMIGNIDLENLNTNIPAERVGGYDYFDCLGGAYHNTCRFHDDNFSESGKIHWVVIGGESGFNARSLYTEWVESIRDQCKENNTPFFFKQYSQTDRKDYKNAILDGKLYKEYPTGLML